MFARAMIVLAVLLLLNPAPRAWAQNDVQQERFLSNCSGTPNCVSSFVRDERHWVAPLFLRGDTAIAWEVVREAAMALPRTRVVAESEGTLHLECRSRFFRFVDDLHLVLDFETKTVHVRSASRVGYWDFGVNRRRIEALRAALQKKGVVR